MDDRASALEQRRRQPGEVADAATAKRDDRRVAGRAPFGQAGQQLMEDCPVLGRFTLGHENWIGFQRFGDGRSVKREDPRLADQDRAPSSRQVADSLEARFRGADEHVIATRRGVDPDDRHSARCS
jgi:hypothetical protein